MIGSEHRRIGLNLLAKRRELQMTQKELSEVSGLSRYKISRMESGKVDFTIKELMLVAKALKMDYLALVK